MNEHGQQEENAARKTGFTGLSLSLIEGPGGLTANPAAMVQFREDFSNYARLTFPTVASIISNPVGVDMADPARPRIGDPHVQDQEDLTTFKAVWARKIAALEVNKRALFGALLSACDANTQTLARGHALYRGWNLDVDDTKVHRLLQVLWTISNNPVGVSEGQKEHAAVQSLIEIAMKPAGETAANFAKRVVSTVATTRAASNWPITEEFMAYSIIHGLRGAYDEIKTKVLSDAARQGGVMPATVEEALVAIHRYAVVTGTPVKILAAAVVDPEKMKMLTPEDRALVDKDGMIVKPDGRKFTVDSQLRFYKLKHRNDEQRKKKALKGPANGPTAGGASNNRSKPDDSQQQRSMQRGANGKNSSAGQLLKEPKTVMAALVKQAYQTGRLEGYAESKDGGGDGDSDDDGLDFRDYIGMPVHVATSTMSDAARALVVLAAAFFALCAWHSKIGAVYAATVAMNAALVLFVIFMLVDSRTVKIGENIRAMVVQTGEERVYLDTGAEKHVFGTRSSCSSFENVAPMFIRGAGGTTVTSTTAMLDLVKMRGIYLDNCPSVLAMTQLLPTHKIDLDRADGKFFLATPKEGSGFDETLVFMREGNLYPLMMKISESGEVAWKHRAITKEKAIAHARILRSDKRARPPIRVNAAMCSSDVKRGLAEMRPASTRRCAGAKAGEGDPDMPELKTICRHTRREVTSAMEARWMQQALGTSAGDLKVLLKQGSIGDSTVTSADVDRAEAIYGKRVSALLANPFRARQVPPASVAGRTIDRGPDLMQRGEVDIFKLWGQQYLMTTVAPLGVDLATKIDNRSEAEITKAVTGHIDKIRAAGFEIEEIKADNEAGLKASTHVLAERNVKLINTARGEHAYKVERRGGLLRQRVLARCMDLPFALPLSWTPYCIRNEITMKMYCPSGSRSDSFAGPTAGERFLGKKILSSDLRYMFGHYVVSKVPSDREKDKNQPDRDDGICLGRIMESDNSLYFYSFRYKKVVVREWNQLTRVPPTAHVIELVNELATNDMRGAKTDFRQKMDRAKSDDLMTEDKKDSSDLFEDLADLYVNRERIKEDFALAKDLTAAREHESDERPHEKKEATSQNTSPASSTKGGRAKIGDLFQKRFGDGKLYVGRVVSIEAAGKGGAKRRCIYDDGDEEDLHAWEISQLQNKHGPPSAAKAERLISLACHVAEDQSIAGDAYREWYVAFPKEALAAKLAVVIAFSKISRRRAKTAKQKVETHLLLNLTVKKAMELFPQQTHEANLQEVAKILERTFRPIDYRRLNGDEKQKIIPAFMFLKAKYDSQGNFTKVKSRLVAAQNRARQDPESPLDPYSPTLGKTTMVTLIAIATKKNYVMKCADIESAYLHAPIDQRGGRVFARMDKAATACSLELFPELSVLLDSNGFLVGECHYSLYGLQQSGHNFNEHLSATLKALGFERNEHDACVFRRECENGEVLIGVFVDDLMLIAAAAFEIDDVINELRKTYPKMAVTDGKLQSYLGVTIDSSEIGATYLHQEHYVNSMLEQYKVVHTRTSPAPLDLMSENDNSPPLEGSDFNDFRSRVYKVAYLSDHTRPDCLFAVNHLSQRAHRATKKDMDNLNWLLGYIKHTKHYGITISARESLDVHCFVDAAYGNAEGKKSVTGCVMQLGLGGGPVFCKSSKQRQISRSSFECELTAATDMISQAIWLRRFLMSLKVPQGPIILYQDNEAAIKTLMSGRLTALKTRHIDIRFRWIKQYIENGTILVVHMGTDRMIADALTKPLVGGLLHKMTKWTLGWEEHPGPEKGPKNASKGGGASTSQDEDEEE